MSSLQQASEACTLSADVLARPAADADRMSRVPLPTLLPREDSAVVAIPIEKMNSTESPSPELPPYTYVPGLAPHPISHADGHMSTEEVSGKFVGDHQGFGCRLFDAGYYWEAHESWEHRWIELGRRGPDADCVKGLIKLAACGVKVLEGNQIGALRHANRCEELLAIAFSLEALKGREFENALRVVRQYLSHPFVLSSFDPWRPEPLKGWHLANDQPT